MKSDESPGLIQRFISLFEAPSTETETYEGNYCPHCGAGLSEWKVENKVTGETISYNKKCGYCGWRPGEKPKRSRKEAMRRVRAQAELADRMHQRMRNHD